MRSGRDAVSAVIRSCQIRGEQRRLGPHHVLLQRIVRLTLRAVWTGMYTARELMDKYAHNVTTRSVQ